jgi:hypothetical protein
VLISPRHFSLLEDLAGLCHHGLALPIGSSGGRRRPAHEEDSKVCVDHAVAVTDHA